MKILLVAVIALVGAVVFMRLLEHASLYFPAKEVLSSPKMLGMDFTEVSFKTKDRVTLSGWYIPAKAKANPWVFLFSHGNGGNISHRVEKIRLLHNLGVSVFIYDYRGYGRSEGRPGESGLYRDAEAAYAALIQDIKIDASRIVLYGESLGGAVAAQLATEVGAAGLIVEDTFTSVRDMARRIYPFLPGYFIRSQYATIDKVSRIGMPKLFIHSQDDEIVPYKMGEELYRRAGEPKSFVKLRGGHNSAFLESQEEYLDGIDDFLKGLAT